MFLRICNAGACFLSVTTICQAIVAIVVIVTVLKSISGPTSEKWIRLPTPRPGVLTIGFHDGDKVLTSNIFSEDELPDMGTVHNSNKMLSFPEVAISGPKDHHDEAEKVRNKLPEAPLAAAACKSWFPSKGRAAVVSPSWHEIVDAPQREMLENYSAARANDGMTQQPPPAPDESLKICGNQRRENSSAFSSENRSSSEESERGGEEDRSPERLSTTFESGEQDITAMMDRIAATGAAEVDALEDGRTAVFDAGVVTTPAPSLPPPPVPRRCGKEEDVEHTHENEREERGRRKPAEFPHSRQPLAIDITMPPPAKRQRTSKCVDYMQVHNLCKTNRNHLSKIKPPIASPLAQDHPSDPDLTFRQTPQKQKQRQTQNKNVRQSQEQEQEQKHREGSQTSFGGPPRQPLTPKAPLRSMATVSSRPTVAAITPPLTSWSRRGRLSCIMKPKPAVPRQSPRHFKHSAMGIKSSLLLPRTSVEDNYDASTTASIVDENSPSESHEKQRLEHRHYRSVRKGSSNLRDDQELKLHPSLKSKSKLQDVPAPSHHRFNYGSEDMIVSTGLLPLGKKLQGEGDVGEQGSGGNWTFVPNPPSTLCNPVNFVATAAAPDFEFTIQGTMRISEAADAASPPASVNGQFAEVSSSRGLPRETNAGTFPSNSQGSTIEDISAKLAIGVGETQAPSSVFPKSVTSDACADDASFDITIHREPPFRCKNSSSASSMGFLSSTSVFSPTSVQNQEFVSKSKDSAQSYLYSGDSPKCTQTSRFSSSTENSGRGVHTNDGHAIDRSGSCHPFPSEPIPTTDHEQTPESSRAAPKTEDQSIPETTPQTPKSRAYNNGETELVGLASGEGSDSLCPRQIQVSSPHPLAENEEPIQQCQPSSSAPHDSLRSSDSSSDFRSGAKADLPVELAQETQMKDSPLQSLQLVRSSSINMPLLGAVPMTAIKPATGSTCIGAETTSTSASEAETGTFFFSYCDTCKDFPRYRNV